MNNDLSLSSHSSFVAPASLLPVLLITLFLTGMKLPLVIGIGLILAITLVAVIHGETKI